jgi:hypothetical protein
MKTVGLQNEQHQTRRLAGYAPAATQLASSRTAGFFLAEERIDMNDAPFDYIPSEYEDGGYGWAHAELLELVDFGQDYAYDFKLLDGPFEGEPARTLTLDNKVFEESDFGKTFIVEYELAPGFGHRGGKVVRYADRIWSNSNCLPSQEAASNDTREDRDPQTNELTPGWIAFMNGGEVSEPTTNQ